MISIERITSEDSLWALKPEWNSLLQRSNSNCVFLTFEWLSTWWKHLADGRRLEVITARDNDRLVGILPLCCRRPQYSRMIPRILEFIGTGVIGSDYLDAIIDSEHEEDALAAFAHHLDGRGVMLQFSQLNRASSRARQLVTRLA